MPTLPENQSDIAFALGPDFKRAEMAAVFRRKILKFFAVVVLLLGVLAFFMRGSRDLSTRVTTQSIRAVALGMSEAQVIQLLGEPLDRQIRGDGLQTLQFSRPIHGGGVEWHPMLWVHFQNGLVDGIYAKRYILWGADDDVVYLVSAKQRTYISPVFEKVFPHSK